MRSALSYRHSSLSRRCESIGREQEAANRVIAPLQCVSRLQRICLITVYFCTLCWIDQQILSIPNPMIVGRCVLALLKICQRLTCFSCREREGPTNSQPERHSSNRPGPSRPRDPVLVTPGLSTSGTPSSSQPVAGSSRPEGPIPSTVPAVNPHSLSVDAPSSSRASKGFSSDAPPTAPWLSSEMPSPSAPTMRSPLPARRRR